MTELFVSVFSISVTVGLATHLMHARYRGHITTFSLGVIFLFVAVSAVPRIDMPDLDINGLLPDAGAHGDGYYAVRAAVCDGIARTVADEFGFGDGEVSAELIGFDIENMRCDTVVVTLCGTAALGDYKRVERFVSEIGIGECRVDVQIG